MEDGPPIFRQDFTCLALLNMSHLQFRIQDYHLLRLAFPRHFTTTKLIGYSPFARRYLGNRFYFLFLPLLRCFSSRAYRFHAYPPDMQVFPFGNPGISDYVRLLPAYRSLSRPSSAVVA